MPYSLRIVCGFFNVPQLIPTRGCETGPPAYSPYPKRLEILLSYFKTPSVAPAGVEHTTSRVTARCSMRSVEEFKYCKEPVSYTHLTLPTKLEV